MDWLRLWHDMPNDPKWRTIARVSGQPISMVQAMYLHLLVDASRNVTRGHVTVTKEDIASALDVTDEQVEAVFIAMQGRVMDGDKLTGWEGRQPKREDVGNPETGAKSASQRKKEQREREKAEKEKAAGHDESRDVTKSHDRLEKIREEKKEQDQKPGAAPKAKSSRFDPLTAKPANVTEKTWADWCQHRREIHKPLTAKSCEQQAKALEGHATPDQVLVNSISNGWTGIFPEKTTSNVHQLPSRHAGFSDRDYTAGLIQREDGSYAF
ncbi:hypothetical protein [Pseudomonas sp. JAI120]|uniref:hypothetical protein n=1 Tax=Pseudomonas sp. JAI120 TaxID=2723063 RepID=UPI0030D78CF3